MALGMVGQRPGETGVVDSIVAALTRQTADCCTGRQRIGSTLPMRLPLTLRALLPAVLLCHLGLGHPAAAQVPRTEAVPADQTATQPAAPMSKQQRQQLLDEVDPMTQFVSADTALPIHQRVKRRLISRDEVNQYLHRQFKDDESTKRLERSELVLKKFGLLERDFDLEPFLISLLTEQIAGYYDNKTKEVNLLDWVAPAEQKPVLAHELTHALQDQTVNLEKWSDSQVHGVSTHGRRGSAPHRHGRA